MEASWITPALRQTWCASGIIIGIIGQGMVLGHTSGMLGELRDPDSPIQIDIHSASWLASSPGPALLLGVVLGCVLMDRYGRRMTNLLAITPGIIGWIVMYSAQNYLMLLIGKILTGFSAGGTNVVGAIMIAEYTDPRYRGMFLTLKTTAVIVGSTVCHVLFICANFRTIALLAIIPHIIVFLMTCTYPESPSWLAAKKRFDQCELDFYWLRGISKRTTLEVSELIKAQKERLQLHEAKTSFRVKTWEILRKFTRKDFLKPLFTVSVAIMISEFAGRHFFPNYGLQIMSEALDTKSLPFYSTLCVDLIVIIGSFLCSILMRILKVRTLLFFSGMTSLIVSACMCTYLFLISRSMISNEYPWIVTALFVLYFFSSNIGCSSIPIVLQGELFPLIHKETCTAVSGAFFSICLTVTLKVTPYLLNATGVHGTFGVFGGLMVVLLMILYFILPETKERTLQDIEHFYSDGRFKNYDDKDNEVKKMLDKDQAW